MSKKIGQILILRKLITMDQLIQALGEQLRINSKSKRKFKLGEILLFTKLIDLKQLQNCLLEQRPRGTA